MKRAVLAVAAFGGLSAGGALYAHWQLYLPTECRGDVPQQVPFHQGMTLCPGQSAILTIVIPQTEGENHGDGGKDL